MVSGVSPVRAGLTRMTCMLPACARCMESSRGIFLMQAVHQVAQKSRMTHFPLNPERLRVCCLWLMVWVNVISGTLSPMDSGLYWVYASTGHRRSVKQERCFIAVTIYVKEFFSVRRLVANAVTPT